MRRESFCEGWLFGEWGKEEGLVSVTLPHDAMQQQGRSPEAPSGTGGGFFLGGKYIYEKQFFGDPKWADQELFLEFEGVYPSAEVFLNGQRIGGCRYGYTRFRVPLSGGCSGLRLGEKNCLRVEVDNSDQPNSRWYSGAGIYRPVWLLAGGREHIAPEGVRVTTLSWDPAEILVEVEHTREDAGPKDVRIEIFFAGAKVAEAWGPSARIPIPDAHLWDDEHPNLYECRVTLRDGASILDEARTRFGIRKLSWSPEAGLQVNGRTVLLRGGCIHHDNGILGARSFAASEYRRIRILKEGGFNAIRSAHNPLCPAALEACDELGVYVMDEAWDMWDKAKNPGDYAKDFAENYPADLASMVEKDYNHPSVILYSIGNEVTEPAKPEGVELAKKLCDRLRDLDSTRPVTAGINLTLLLMAAMEHPIPGTNDSAAPENGDPGIPGMPQEMNSTAYNQMVSEMGNRMTMAAATEGADQISSPVLDLLDICGYNYAVSRYEKEGELHPERIVVGSETYTYELASTWPLVEKLPYLIGDFMWTAWDYLGEAGIGSWSYDPEDLGFQKTYPWLLSGAGAYDILGNDTAAAGLAAVVWGKRTTPYIGVCPMNHPGVIASRAIWRGSNALPYWSYQGCEGNEGDVEIYSRSPEVELFVNGRSLGRKKTENCKAVFSVRYEPGELRAAAYDSAGRKEAESCLTSARGETSIRIRPQRETAGERPAASGEILYLDISLVGENGEIECNRDALLTVTVDGGELLAYGSADPKTEEDFLSGSHTTYYGRSQAVVRVTENYLTVRVSGGGMESVWQRKP